MHRRAERDELQGSARQREQAAVQGHHHLVPLLVRMLYMLSSRLTVRCVADPDRHCPRVQVQSRQRDVASGARLLHDARGRGGRETIIIEKVTSRFLFPCYLLFRRLTLDWHSLSCQGRYAKARSQRP